MEEPTPRIEPRTAASVPWRRLALGALLVWSFALRCWYASTELNGGRYWDEHYAVRNLRAALVDGSLRPVNHYYQSLSYLPQAALLGAAERVVRRVGPKDYSFFSGGGLAPEGYLLCRLTVVAFAVLSLWLTFLLGRRLFSDEVGLAAVLVLSAVPLHIRLSTCFKPDMLVMALTLAALVLSLDALEDPRWRRYLLAGAAVGLAMSAKLTGGLAAIPLAAGAAVAGWRDRRHWLRLCGAGLAAAAVFVSLNFQLDLYLAAFRRNLHMYEVRSQTVNVPGGGRWATLTGIADSLLSPQGHGPVLGACALIGLAALLGLAISRRERTMELFLVAGFPVTFALVYAAVTPYPKANNFLPLLAFSSLAAAWLLVSAWHTVQNLFPVLRWRTAAAAAGLVLAASMAARSAVFCYAVLVPSTWQLALADSASRLDPPDSRMVLFDDPPGWLQARNAAERSARWSVPALDALPAQQISRSDAEVFRLSRLEGDRALFYRQRLQAADGQTRIIQPRLFHTRGEPLVLVLHAAHLSAVTETILVDRPHRGIFALPLTPATGSNESISVEARLPFRRMADLPPPELLLDGHLLPLHFSYKRRRFSIWVSDRLELPAAQHSELRLPKASRLHRIKVRLYRWSHPTPLPPRFDAL